MTERVTWSPDEYARFYKAAQSFGPPKRGDSNYVFRDAALRAGLKPRPFDPVTASKMNKAREKMERHEAPIYKEPAKTVFWPQPETYAKEAVAEPPTAPPAAPEAPQAADHPVLATLASAMTDVFLQVLYDPELRKALRGLVAEALAPEAALEQQQAITWREPKGPMERKLRVVIAGGGLAMHHEMEPIPGVDLRFWSGMDNESPHRLKAILNSADACVLMTKFISHKAQAMATARKDRLKIVYCNGGTNELRPQIAALVQAP